MAILPQMFLLSNTGEAETITTHYLLCLGLYRAFYLLNWIYRFIFDRSPEAVVVLAGILQTALYSDFFYIYYKRYVRNVGPAAMCLAQYHLCRVFSGRAFKLPI